MEPCDATVTRKRRNVKARVVTEEEFFRMMVEKNELRIKLKGKERLLEKKRERLRIQA